MRTERRRLNAMHGKEQCQPIAQVDMLFCKLGRLGVYPTGYFLQFMTMQCSNCLVFAIVLGNKKASEKEAFLIIATSIRK